MNLSDSDLDELYQELIVDHGRRPRNVGPLPDASHHACGHNPLCGDKLTLLLRVQGDVVEEARFAGEGCAISTASASLMTQAVKGLTTAQAEALYHRFHALVTEGVADPESLGKLAAFAGVRRFPARVKCASLAWHTLEAALHPERAETVSTE